MRLKGIIHGQWSRGEDVRGMERSQGPIQEDKSIEPLLGWIQGTEARGDLFDRIGDTVVLKG